MLGGYYDKILDKKVQEPEVIGTMLEEVNKVQFSASSAEWILNFVEQWYILRSGNFTASFSAEQLILGSFALV